MSVIGGASATAAAQLAAVAAQPGTSPVRAPEPRIPTPDARPADVRTPIDVGTPFDLTSLRDLPAGVPTVDDILAKLGRGPQPEPTQNDTTHPNTKHPESTAPAGTPPAAEKPAEALATNLPEESLDDLLAELDGLIGLARVKSEIKRQAQLLRIDKLRAEAGMATPTLTRHLVFTGNPGTGKTTVARLVSRIYRALGILSAGKLIEVDRSELVAGYLGQTASKTSDVISSARGGVLFIDEAYALALDQYGAEAVTTLVKDMEDHRADLVVIVAGYSGPMQSFLDTNPGLASRFSTTIDFADYTDAELRQIFELTAKKADFDPTPETLTAFDDLAAQQARTEAFGNGRWVRNVLDASIARHAWRLRDVDEPTIEQLRTLVPEDLAEPPDPARVADAIDRGLEAGAATDEPADPDPADHVTADPSKESSA
ncbi:AAA family ATPase [Microbacteriaceae bacterium VKM Ac-2855]|nr:AAA family ATPase [Microbacteriaceae bacterium VKM Ac-2855]